ncbi:MAG: FAD-linked oxidase C-terminal domain-containing protein, partial [Candidatus Thorarchaeota archaeon]
NNGFWLNTCHLRPITTIPHLMKKLWTIFDKHKMLKNGIKWIASCLGADRAYATGWITLFPPDRERMGLATKIWNEMLDTIIETGGCPYWQGILWESRAHERTDKSFLDTYWKIKRSLDPDNILAPDVFTGGVE